MDCVEASSDSARVAASRPKSRSAMSHQARNIATWAEATIAHCIAEDNSVPQQHTHPDLHIQRARRPGSGTLAGGATTQNMAQRWTYGGRVCSVIGVRAGPGHKGGGLTCPNPEGQPNQGQSRLDDLWRCYGPVRSSSLPGGWHPGWSERRIQVGSKRRFLA